MNRIDLSRQTIGFISGFDEGKGRTGWQVKVLVRGLEHTFDATKEAYDIRWTKEFFPYPCLGEVLFMLQFDGNGILTGYVVVNDITVENNPVQTGLVMGTYAMFKKQITEATPTFGEILDIEGNAVTLKNYDKWVADGTICHSVWGGTMPTPRDGMTFHLAPDCVVYLWDWSTALHPFCKCTREEAAAYRFVTKFEIGSREDIKRAYWVGFYSTRGDESVIDTIKCFPNKAPGWTD